MRGGSCPPETGQISPHDLSPGTLLVAPPSQDADPTFGRTVVAVVDREPNGITSALVLNRPLERTVVELSALALRFAPSPTAPIFWGGPMGEDPAVLAQFSDTSDLEWFHLAVQQRRPFLLADVGVIAVAEHSDVFEGRIRRARVFVGLSVWGRGQLEAELARGAWRLARATSEDLFTPAPGALWASVLARAAEPT